MSDPPRLSGDSGSKAEQRLGRLVEASRRDVGSDEQLAALESRLLPLLGPPAPPGAAESLPKAAPVVASGTLKALVVSGVVTVVAAAWVVTRPSPSPTLAPSPARTASARSVESEPAPSAPASTEAPPREETPASSTRVQAAPLPSEADLVGEAQTVLTTNPARALALCDRHRRLFPQGVLVQEREVLAVEALERLGRHEQASARGARFLALFPGSAHRSKIAAIVGSR